MAWRARASQNGCASRRPEKVSSYASKESPNAKEISLRCDTRPIVSFPIFFFQTLDDNRNCNSKAIRRKLKFHYTQWCSFVVVGRVCSRRFVG